MQLTKWFTQQSQAPTSKVNSTPGMEITLVEITPFEQKYHISLQKSELVTINTAFFPGWKAKVDDKRIDIENKNGLIAVRLPEGKSELTLNFSDTNIRTVGKIISGITFFMVILIMLKKSATIKI